MGDRAKPGDPHGGLPWSRPPSLEPKPEGMEYGYVTVDRRGRSQATHGATPEVVREKVASGEAARVVVPEMETVAPPSIVRQLWPAVQQRERRRRETERKNALFNALVFGAIALYSIRSKDPAWQIVVLIFVLFGFVPLLQYVIGAARRLMHGEDTFEETRDRALFSFWLDAEPTPATRWGVRVLVGIFVLQVLVSASSGTNFLTGLVRHVFLVGPAAIEAAGLVKVAVRDGEIWRLLTGGLVHGGLLHIGFNAVAFASVGAGLERFCGWVIMLATFTLSVLGGALASFLAAPHATSVGASGGVCGLVGFLLVVAVRHRHALPADLAKSIVRSVLFMAAVGFLARDYIDNAAHVGGFLVGCLVAWPLSRDVRELGRYPDFDLLRQVGWGTVAVLGAAVLWSTFRLGAAAGWL